MGNLLNLERVPNLAPKFANKIGKSAEAYFIAYTGEGVSVKVKSLLDSNGEKITEAEPVGLVEFERRVALSNRPTDGERLRALRNKFEMRLEKEFPSQGPASGSEADIQAWLGNLPWQDRVTLLKSQKDFEASKSKSGQAA